MATNRFIAGDEFEILKIDQWEPALMNVEKILTVEFCYPKLNVPLLDEKEGEDIALPKQWQALPYLAMPDGAHHYEEDHSFFHLPALTKGSRLSTDTIFGVSCFRQIDSKKLKNKDENVTRTTVQKSVCVLMRLPLYNYVLTKLELVTHAYFNELDFSKTDILKECYDTLSLQLSTMKIDNSLFHLGLDVQDIVSNFKQKVLQLFKLLLLEKKVVIWGTPVKEACKFILSLISLFPGLLNKGLLHTTCVDSVAVAKGAQTPRDIHGLPLDLFGEGCLFQPYMSLHNMTLLRKTKVNSFVVAGSNILFKQKLHCPYDVLVDLETFTMTVPDPGLNSLLELSTEDLRFCEYITAVVENSNENTGKTLATLRSREKESLGDRFLDVWSSTGWEGSDDWLRLQFKAYLLCLLSTVQNTTEEELMELHPFNGPYCQTWTQTKNYRRWSNTDHPGMEHFHKGHPFQGDITVSDVRLRINHISESFANEETRKKIAEALLRAQAAVDGAITSAKTAINSAKGWVNGVVNEIEVEMRKHKENKIQNTKTIDISSAKMVITDRDRKGEQVKTIGDLIGNNSIDDGDDTAEDITENTAEDITENTAENNTENTTEDITENT